MPSASTSVSPKRRRWRSFRRTTARPSTPTGSASSRTTRRSRRRSSTTGRSPGTSVAGRRTGGARSATGSAGSSGAAAWPHAPWPSSSRISRGPSTHGWQVATSTRSACAAYGVTMRNLRCCRQLWAVRMGLIPPTVAVGGPAGADRRTGWTVAGAPRAALGRQLATRTSSIGWALPADLPCKLLPA